MITTNYVLCNIVVNQIKGNKDCTIYMQDYSFDSKEEKFPFWTRKTLDPKYIRTFKSMKDFTLFLLRYSCVVENCLITIDDYD